MSSERRRRVHAGLSRGSDAAVASPPCAVGDEGRACESALYFAKTSVGVWTAGRTRERREDREHNVCVCARGGTMDGLRVSALCERRECGGGRVGAHEWRLPAWSASGRLCLPLCLT